MTETSFQVAFRVEKIRMRNGEFELKIKLEGLLDYMDFTWEPITVMSQDVPDMVLEFLGTPVHKALKNKAKSVLKQMT